MNDATDLMYRSMSWQELQAAYYQDSNLSVADRMTVCGYLVTRQTAERAIYAKELGNQLMKVKHESQLRKAASFTVRCDSGCQLAMIFGRKNLTHSGGPPKNELIMCWTRHGWRAELLRWYITDSFYDRIWSLPVACKHGTGLFAIEEVRSLVCFDGPESVKPTTAFAPGATRRLADPYEPARTTVGDFLLGSSWRAHHHPKI